jgi:hypothetical protein
MSNDQALEATAARLRGYLARIAQQYPEIWKNVDRVRAERGRALPHWPSWCFVRAPQLRRYLRVWL